MAGQQDVAMAVHPTPEETFANHIGTTVRHYLKPEFEQITEQFQQVAGRLDAFESGTRTRLASIEATLKKLADKLLS